MALPKEDTSRPQSMTSRQRVLAALKRQPVDRTPVCNPTSVATVELMDLVDAHFPDANRNPEKMARIAATSYTNSCMSRLTKTINYTAKN